MLHPISELIEILATFLLLLHDPVYIFTDRIEAFDFAWYLVMVIRSILEDWPWQSMIVNIEIILMMVIIVDSNLNLLLAFLS